MASTMSGERAGVQALIKERLTNAIYMHSAGHSLNLAIMKSCSIPPIRNFVEKKKEFTIWIQYSCEKGGSPQGYWA